MPARIRAAICERPPGRDVSKVFNRCTKTAASQPSMMRRRHVPLGSSPSNTLRSAGGRLRLALSVGWSEPFAGRLLNIHPSLLPKYPGLHTHQRALDAGWDPDEPPDFIFKDRPAHWDFRRIVAPEFTPKAMRKRED